MSVNLSVNTRIEKLHFSQIIFDQQDVERSRKYALVYKNYNFDENGDFIEVPSEFVDNLILGLMDFSTEKTRAAIYFNWEFMTVSGEHGVNVEASVPLA